MFRDLFCHLKHLQMQYLLVLVPKKGKEFSQHHGESCYTQDTANNVNKLGDIYIRSVILIELVVLRENW